MKYGFLLLVLNICAAASTITLDADLARISNASAAGVQTRYKVDQTNWDMMLGNGVQPISGSSITTAGLGNVAQLSNTNWRYEVENLPGQGIYFKMTNLTSQTSRLLAWGSFQPDVLPTATSTTTVASLNSITPSPFYNALHLLAIANSAGSVTFSGATFSVKTPGINVAGSMPASGGATWAGSAVKDEVYIAYTSSTGQPLDLGQVAWAFATNVNVTRTTGSSENVKFEFTGKTLQYEGSQVPEPASIMMTGAALAFAALIARSRLVQRFLVNA